MVLNVLKLLFFLLNAGRQLILSQERFYTISYEKLNSCTAEDLEAFRSKLASTAVRTVLIQGQKKWVNVLKDALILEPGSQLQAAKDLAD